VKPSMQRLWRTGRAELNGLEHLKGTRREWPHTSITYMMTHRPRGSALANLDAVLPPFADAVSKYTGMVAVVTIIGPSGEDGGDLVVRR
jgi:hypothetical protein